MGGRRQRQTRSELGWLAAEAERSRVAGGGGGELGRSAVEEEVEHTVRANRRIIFLDPHCLHSSPSPSSAPLYHPQLAGFAPASAVLNSLLPVSDGGEGREKRERERERAEGRIGERDRIERDIERVSN